MLMCTHGDLGHPTQVHGFQAMVIGLETATAALHGGVRRLANSKHPSSVVIHEPSSVDHCGRTPAQVSHGRRSVVHHRRLSIDDSSAATLRQKEPPYAKSAQWVLFAAMSKGRYADACHVTNLRSDNISHPDSRRDNGHNVSDVV